jgi:hypothetical protein
VWAILRSRREASVKAYGALIIRESCNKYKNFEEKKVVVLKKWRCWLPVEERKDFLTE